DKKVMKNIYDSLRRNGVLIVDMMGKEINARIFMPRDWRRDGDYFLLEERKIVDDWRRIDMNWIVIKDNIIKELKFNFRLFSAAELDGLLRESGFKEIKFYGDLKGSPYDHKAMRLITVARKI
ncbi:MAG: methyltransferase type 11, partial [Candidatus Zixiibacteriota bacterium]